VKFQRKKLSDVFRLTPIATDGLYETYKQRYEHAEREYNFLSWYSATKKLNSG